MSYLKTKRTIVALSGEHSKYRRTVGIGGNDTTISVPLGTEFKFGNAFIGNVENNGQKILIAQGGEGGNSKNGFIGKVGSKKDLSLDYKLIGDLAMVGFPNAGKSTLLSAITRAKPKIADYPFTTICPQTGVVEFADGRELVAADLPGLVEDEKAAHHLGMAPQQRFLKHLSRVKIILYVVDITGFRLLKNSRHLSALETILLASKVIEDFDASFVSKSRILAINKIDKDPNFIYREALLDFIRRMPGSLDDVDETMRPKTGFKFSEVFEICGKDRKGTEEMMKCVRRQIDDTHCPNNRSSSYKEVMGIKLIEHNTTKLV